MGMQRGFDSALYLAAEAVLYLTGNLESGVEMLRLDQLPT
jgi:hypothetical protein